MAHLPHYGWVNGTGPGRTCDHWIDESRNLPTLVDQGRLAYFAPIDSWTRNSGYWPILTKDRNVRFAPSSVVSTELHTIRATLIPASESRVRTVDCP